ncbi:MAG: hypothetical protein KDA71_05885, partial [Planctomycetales bacterium]|nr:hypothetical protein [Planctomycetales bacterium]
MTRDRIAVGRAALTVLIAVNWTPPLAHAEEPASNAAAVRPEIEALIDAKQVLASHRSYQESVQELQAEELKALNRSTDYPSKWSARDSTTIFL